ncbi:hypothetical protein ACLKA6_015351 [Drosophila palustris]
MAPSGNKKKLQKKNTSATKQQPNTKKMTTKDEQVVDTPRPEVNQDVTIIERKPANIAASTPAILGSTKRSVTSEGSQFSRTSSKVQRLQVQLEYLKKQEHLRDQMAKQEQERERLEFQQKQLELEQKLRIVQLGSDKASMADDINHAENDGYPEDRTRDWVNTAHHNLLNKSCRHFQGTH